MREKLQLSPGGDGALWQYAAGTPLSFAHRHEEMEINLVTRGRADYLVKDRRHQLRRGSILWLFPDQEHLLIERSPDFLMWILVFRRRLLQRTCCEPAHRVLRARDPEGTFCAQLAEPDFHRLGELLADLEEQPPPSDRFRAALAYILLEAWAMHQRARQAVPTRRVHPAVEQAARLLYAQPAGAHLCVLAQSVGLSPSRLSRLFSRQMGLTLVQYRQRRLIERFLDAFAQHPGHKLSSLALQAGFGSYPQFHRVFRKLMGRPPADFLQHPE